MINAGGKALLPAPVALRPPDERARAFCVQYLSVILIVLSFTIGAFLRGGPSTPAPEQQAAALPPPPPAALGEMQYTDLFVRGQTTMDEDKLAAAAEFLKSHDVRAEIDLFAEEAEAEGFLPLARAVVLSRFFESAGVPDEAYAVYARETIQAPQAEVRIYRMGGRHD